MIIKTILCPHNLKRIRYSDPKAASLLKLRLLDHSHY